MQGANFGTFRFAKVRIRGIIRWRKHGQNIEAIDAINLRPGIKENMPLIPGHFSQGDNAAEIRFGKKLCSCVTLLREAAPEEKVFSDVLDKFYGGREDPQTLRMLAGKGDLK